MGAKTVFNENYTSINLLKTFGCKQMHKNPAESALGIETFGERKKYRRYIFVTPSCQCLKLKQYYLVEGYDYPKRWLDSYILHD